MADAPASTVLEELCCPPVAGDLLSEDDATVLAGVLKAVADPVRLRLLNLVAQAGEICACDLPELLDRSQPTISHHLGVLVKAGLLDRSKRGKWAWFSVRESQLEALGEVFRSPGRSA